MYDKHQVEHLRRAMRQLSRAEETLAAVADLARDQGRDGAAAAFGGLRSDAADLCGRVRYCVVLMGKGSADASQ